MVSPAKAVESEVRSYSRMWPREFVTGRGAWLVDSSGERFIDFFAGAGALNYGHNDPLMTEAIIEYLHGDGIVHSLDMFTIARSLFLESFGGRILGPRDLDYRVQFTGPTGTNSVEAAIKLARKVTRRRNIVAFAGGFHGMTLGSLALTGNISKRSGAGVELNGVVRLPFENDVAGVDELGLLEFLLSNPSSGIELPAAVVLETVQAEGGVNVASRSWLERLARICNRHGVLLIVDDVQTGCGRTGTFFSWENTGIVPDMVCLSKSLGGYGVPFAITLIRPELDQWSPGEHNGTFRGNNIAFVTARAAIEAYWTSTSFEDGIVERSLVIESVLNTLAVKYGDAVCRPRGRGMIWGLEFVKSTVAEAISRAAFNDENLLVEVCGAHSQVVKLLPPLNIDMTDLEDGLRRLERAVVSCFSSASRRGVEQNGVQLRNGLG